MTKSDGRWAAGKLSIRADLTWPSSLGGQSPPLRRCTGTFQGPPTEASRSKDAWTPQSHHEHQLLGRGDIITSHPPQRFLHFLFPPWFLLSHVSWKTLGTDMSKTPATLKNTSLRASTWFDFICMTTLGGKNRTDQTAKARRGTVALSQARVQSWSQQSRRLPGLFLLLPQSPPKLPPLDTTAQ